MADCIEKSEIYRRFFNGGNGKAWIHISDIDTIPAVDVASVVHGRWRKSRNIFGLSVCSECQETNFSSTSYCPNCGAKMDKTVIYREHRKEP